MRRRRRGRPVHGIIPLNKPAGRSSNAVLQEVKSLLQAAKAGHTGSLDPLATGVLPICCGEATKFAQFLLNADKGYYSTLRFGIETDSGDSDGCEISRASAATISAVAVERALAPLRGEIQQVPSMFSALKRDGQPLYKLARRGIKVALEARPVTVHELRLLDFRAGEVAEAELKIHCSKGTYVRMLAVELGRELGCGAHVTALHRYQAGGFDDADTVSMEQLRELSEAGCMADMDALLRPVGDAVGHLPEVCLQAVDGHYLCRGQAVRADGAASSGLVRLRLADGQFLGVGEVLADGKLAPRRLVAA